MKDGLSLAYGDMLAQWAGLMIWETRSALAEVMDRLAFSAADDVQIIIHATQVMLLGGKEIRGIP